VEQKERLIIAFVLVIGILTAAFAYVFIALPRQSPGDLVNAPQAQTPPPEVKMYKVRGMLRLEWHNLPEGTDRISIYRAHRGTEDWARWQTIQISDLLRESGFVEIALKKGEDISDFIFKAEAAKVAPSSSASGTPSGDTIVLWTSSSSEALPYVPPVSSPAPTSTPGTPAPLPPATSTTPTPSSTPPAVTPNPQSSSTGQYYYNPQGQIAGEVQTQSNPFWVEHVHKAIEIGWQSLPSGDAAVVYRSTTEHGPWQELFRRTNPEPTSLIRLVDDALNTDHYYLLRLIQDGTIVKQYGPVFLPKLEE
jgi:hypothetical protein